MHATSVVGASMVGGVRVWLFLCAGLFTGTSFAAVDDSRFATTPDGQFDYELHDVARRDVLARLFADQGIRLDWLDPAVANDRLSGGYRGSLSQVARQLLEKLNFILVYDMTGDAPRITRIVVSGLSQGQPSPSMAVLQSALRKAETAKSGESAGTHGPSTIVGNASATKPTPNRSFPFAGGGTGSARGPAPIPISTSNALLAPVPHAAPADLQPTPITAGLPSVAPIAGATLPTLPPPVSSGPTSK